ncbi:MAG: copper amine oxidase N-terminal domain-containing protein [Eubacteriales bacterium]|nr:copper amine oxidase N-terminal domain-containing protein [Eubacteriales bacterium]
MKKIFAIILCLSVIIGICPIASAQELVIVELNGAELDFDVPAQIMNDRTLVPLRGIFEALGATVEWDDTTQTVTAYRGDKTISLQIGSKSLFVNKDEKVLDVPAQLVDGRTLVPARAVAESLGAKIDWDDSAHTVLITDETIYNYGALLDTIIKMPAPEKINGDFNMFVSLRMNANEMNTGVEANIEATKEPPAMSANVYMSNGHAVVDTKVYTINEDGAVKLYMGVKDGDEYVYTSSAINSVADVISYDYVSGRIFFDLADSIKVAREEDLENRKTVKYIATISGENIKKLILATRANVVIPDYTGLEDVLENIKPTAEIKVPLWIDKDLAQPVKSTINLEPLMNEIFTTEGMELAVVKAFNITMTAGEEQ